MRTLVSLGLGALLAVGCASGGQTGDPPKFDAMVVEQCDPVCAGDTACCQTGSVWSCQDVKNGNLARCGSCENSCAPGKADNCSDGLCKCGFAQQCTGELGCCSDGCKDLENDEDNCGSCGNQCGQGMTCSGGQCLCGSTACTGSANACCGGECVNLNTSADNCGSCNNECSGMFDACVNGECGCAGGGTCPTEPTDGVSMVVVTACCGSGCTDLCGDIANCGSCGNACMFNCTAGACDFDINSVKTECFGLALDGGLFPVVDAGVIDAGVPDGEVIDAPVIDAPVIDAGT